MDKNRVSNRAGPAPTPLTAITVGAADKTPHVCHTTKEVRIKEKPLWEVFLKTIQQVVHQTWLSPLFQT